MIKKETVFLETVSLSFMQKAHISCTTFLAANLYSTTNLIASAARVADNILR